MIEIERGCRAAAPKGSMTYAFTHMRNFLLLLLEAGGMAKFGRNWKNLAEFRKIWQNLADIGRIWQKLAEIGRIWKNLEEFGRIWKNLAKYG